MRFVSDIYKEWISQRGQGCFDEAFAFLVATCVSKLQIPSEEQVAALLAEEPETREQTGSSRAWRGAVTDWASDAVDQARLSTAWKERPRR